MLKNYFKLAFRNLIKNKVYSLVNITGLTTGLAACLLVASVVIDELSYDRFWKRSDNIYRILDIGTSKGAEEKGSRTFSGLSPELKKRFPEVKAYCRMDRHSERVILNSDKEGVAFDLLSCEPSVWEVLDFKILEGDPQKYTEGYRNLVITEKIRKQYFPYESPVGKVVRNIPAFGDAAELLITGIVKDIPSNTHLRSDALLIEKRDPEYDILYKSASGTYLTQYVVLTGNVNLNRFTSKVNDWYQNDFLEVDDPHSFEFQPVNQVYLQSDFEKSKVQGSFRNIYIFSIVSVLLLLIACINFVNLTTARALKRMQEAGVRKVLGAGKRDLIAQFLFESLLFFLISFSLAIIVYNFFLNPLQGYLGHELAITLSGNLTLFAVTCAFVLIISLFTGLYPALMITRPRTVNIIKGKLAVAGDSAWLRKSLIVGQFVISVVIIISTIVVQTQIRFMGKKDLGYDKDNLMQLEFTNWGNKGAAFKQELLKLPGIENVSITGWYPTNGPGNMTSLITDPDDADKKIKVNYISGDSDLSSTLKLRLQSGRFLSDELKTDAKIPDSLKNKYLSQGNVLLTEYTAKRFDIKQLNKVLAGIQGIPVGIVKDFNTQSLHFALTPTVIETDNKLDYGYMLIRVKPGFQVLQSIGELYQRFYPEKAFSFSWVDHKIEEQYRAEFKLQQLFISFSFLIIFLACLGLFGLVTFTVEQRIKEIGIRKVLGASVEQVSYLISKDFLKLVVTAIIIAAPIAWLAMSRWLEDFAYRVELKPWMFLMAGSIAILIALLTVSFQAIKAALANPVESLRSE